MSETIVVGSETFSRRHLKVFRREELEEIFGEVAEDLARVAEATVVFSSPLSVEVEFCGNRYSLPPGITHVRGASLSVPRCTYVPEYLDEEFLEYLLFDLPRELDGTRAPVVVEDMPRRFTRWAREGVLYALDILSRVARVYRVPVVVYGDEETEGLWRYARRFACIREGPERACFVDGEPCGEPHAYPY